MPDESGADPRELTGGQRLIALAIIAVYLAVTVALAFTARPLNDEGAYANPGYNLVHNGRMGITLYPMPDYFPLSAAQRTYIQPPLYFLVTAGLYPVAGVGVVRIRAISILFGLICLISWFTTVRNLMKSASAALLAAALIAVDYFFLMGASHGRMDIMCVGFGSAGLAVYTQWREKKLGAAIFWGNFLAGLALLTHPTGIVWAAAVLLAMAVLDFRRWSIKLLMLGALPYLLAGAAWGSYIIQDVTGFRDQMHAQVVQNELSFDTSHLSHIRVVRYLEQELISRYAAPFGLLGGGSLAGRAKILVLATYLAGVFGILLIRRLRQKPGLLLLSLLFLTAFFLLAEISPSKYNYYLPHTTVMMAACAAAFFYSVTPSPRWALILPLVGILAAIQLGGAAVLIRRNDFHREFIPEVQALQKNVPPGGPVAAEGEFWFGLYRDHPLLIDTSIGFNSHMPPAAFEMNSVFRAAHERDRLSNPEEYQYVEQFLARSRLIYEDDYTQLYATESSFK